MRLQTNAHKFIQNITVEPALFFYYLAFILIDVVNTNLYLQKACRLNATTEPDLDTPCDDEKEGVLFVSSLNANYKFYEMISMLVLVTLLMCWSDDAGKKRKVLIILPILGMLGQAINGCLQSYFWYWPPLPGALTDMVIQVISGGFILMIFSTQVYVCDVSSTADRTMRVGILVALKTICSPIGNGISGFLIRSVGFFNSFSVCLLLATASFLSATLLIKDVAVAGENNASIWSLFKLTRVVDSFRVTFKKSLGKKRIIVLLLLMVHTVVLFSTEGEKTVFYLFMRYKFKWDERMFSIYQTYKFAGIIVGTIFCSIIMSKILKIHDGIIGMFAGFWDVMAALGYVFASQIWHLYLIPLLDIFHGTAIAICFSFLTKFYESHEFGRLNAVYNSFSLFIPFCHPTYNLIFQKSLDTFPSAIFVVSVVINIGVCLLYGGAYFLTKKFESEDADEAAKSVEKPSIEKEAGEVNQAFCETLPSESDANGNTNAKIAITEKPENYSKY